MAWRIGQAADWEGAFTSGTGEIGISDKEVPLAKKLRSHIGWESSSTAGIQY